MSAPDPTKRKSALCQGVESILKAHLALIDHDLVAFFDACSARLDRNAKEKDCLKGKATAMEIILQMQETELDRHKHCSGSRTHIPSYVAADISTCDEE
ncbi:hypothetical protein DM02DRAFT_663705 [Periconia macrospinosa]|uniref:Uncharacterized protein n=1 Tax=Periconia macrospinosa TaxID=97972 RepID=A0A2V1D119_9PLEO|nr:hypothetical protein DM02DRAFT_663705 [Periconia macrospinosa]